MRPQLALGCVVAAAAAAALAAPRTAPTGPAEAKLRQPMAGSTEANLTHVMARSTDAQLYTIPVSNHGCGTRQFSQHDEAIVGEIILAEREDQQVQPRWVLTWTYESATWYICNCKMWDWDSFPYAEYRQAKILIAKNCGPGRAGWVYSRTWHKGFGVDNTVLLTLRQRREWCHKGCVSNTGT